jgi:SHS2 domain-containing protein
MPSEFEILEHTADIGFRAWGATREEMFANAALALESVAVQLDAVEEKFPYPIAAAGDDEESLLVNWLSEVLYYLDGRRVAMRRFQVEHLDAHRASGKAFGEPRDPVRHPAKLIVKGVTYHQLRITKEGGRWCAQVFVDI